MKKSYITFFKIKIMFFIENLLGSVRSTVTGKGAMYHTMLVVFFPAKKVFTKVLCCLLIKH